MMLFILAGQCSRRGVPVPQLASPKLVPSTNMDSPVTLFLVAFFFLTSLVLSGHGGGVGARTLSAVWRGPWRHEIVEGVHPQAAVTATFTNRINQTG